MIYYHWEAMLISYLSTRVIVLPFTNIKELVENSDFRIGLNPGSSYEDAFKYSTDTIWQNAYSKRIEPNLDEYRPFYERMIDLPLRDESLALYDNFFAARYSKFPNKRAAARPCSKGNFPPCTRLLGTLHVLCQLSFGAPKRFFLIFFADFLKID